jgi:hypothetical protein
MWISLLVDQRFIQLHHSLPEIPPLVALPSCYLVAILVALLPSLILLVFLLVNIKHDNTTNQQHKHKTRQTQKSALSFLVSQVTP